jgi:hypothetical protein
MLLLTSFYQRVLSVLGCGDDTPSSVNVGRDIPLVAVVGIPLGTTVQSTVMANADSKSLLETSKRRSDELAQHGSEAPDEMGNHNAAWPRHVVLTIVAVVAIVAVVLLLLLAIVSTILLGGSRPRSQSRQEIPSSISEPDLLANTSSAELDEEVCSASPKLGPGACSSCITVRCYRWILISI